MHIKYLIAFDIKTVKVASDWKIVKIPAALINVDTGVVEKVYRRDFRLTNTIAPLPTPPPAPPLRSSLSPVKMQNEFALYAFFNWLMMTCKRNSLMIPKVQSDYLDPNLNCLICIWNDNNMQVYNILVEYNRIGIDIPDSFQFVMDMHELFEKLMKMKGVTLENALEKFEKKFEGRTNYIVDKVINVARLSRELINQIKFKD